MLLTITADDFGLSPSYDRGITEAARLGALDSVSVMSPRLHGRPQRLIETGVELGLHLEADDASGVSAQWERFTEIFGAAPSYIDGHHHSHLRGELFDKVCEYAIEWEIPVRSVGASDRYQLRSRGVQTQDALFGRFSEREPLTPPEPLPSGWVVWVTHPGYSIGRGARSSYDAGREEDLRLLLTYETPDGVRRVTHKAAASERAQLN